MCEGTIATKFEEASGDMAEITKAKTLLKHHRIIHRQGVDRCWNLMESPDKLYKCATAIGYEFDSTFQTLHGIPNCEDTDTATTVCLEEWKTGPPYQLYSTG